MIKLESLRLSDKVLLHPRKNLILDSINNQMTSDTIEIRELNQLLYRLRKDSINLSNPDETSRQKQNLRETSNLAYENLYSAVLLEGYNLNWWSFGIKLNNRTFNLFDKTSSFDDQIVKKRFNQVEIGTSWNMYKLAPDEAFKSFFITLGASYIFDDNFDELTSMTLVQKDSISSYPSERSISESKTIYTGEYKSEIDYWKVNCDFYWFLNKKNSFAFHANPSIRTTFKARPKIDTRVGIVLGFKNQEDTKNLMNIELFYNMSDMFKNVDDNEKLEDRTALGLNINFPIVFKSNNYGS